MIGHIWFRSFYYFLEELKNSDAANVTPPFFSPHFPEITTQELLATIFPMDSFMLLLALHIPQTI